MDGTGDYYRKRITESGDKYGPPEIQADFARVATWLRENVARRNVLEVACGGGHWTEIASAAAKWILASDVDVNIVEAARRKVTAPNVDFIVADAYQFPAKPFTFECGMAQFWLSHVRRSAVRSFIEGFSRHFTPGSRLLFTDTKWVEGYRHPIHRSDEEGNTYQLRVLKDGTRHEILKNYFTREHWAEFLGGFGSVEIKELDYIWAVALELR